MSTKTLCIILAILVALGYTGGYWGGQWYLGSGNHYFHLITGFFLALLIASYYASEFAKLSQPFRFFCLLAIVIALGAIWELHEYAFGRLLAIPLQGNLADTMQDLALDTVGGAVATLYVFRRRNSE